MAHYPPQSICILLALMALCALYCDTFCLSLSSLLEETSMSYLPLYPLLLGVAPELCFPPQNAYAEAPIPTVIIFRDEALGR